MSDDNQTAPLTPKHEDKTPDSSKPYERTRYKSLVKSENGPVANYYAEIRWPQFSQWKVVRFSTPMDGNCLFHSISNAFFAPYHKEKLRGEHMSRYQIVSMLRHELSRKLGEPISKDPGAPTYYDLLNGGNTKVFSEAVPEFTLSNMKRELKSNNPLGFGYLEFIGNALEKDIYILEGKRCDIYSSHELPFTIKGNRKSIVLYYIEGHYELVGLELADGTFATHFEPNHSFIRALNKRVNEIIAQQSKS